MLLLRDVQRFAQCPAEAIEQQRSQCGDRNKKRDSHDYRGLRCGRSVAARALIHGASKGHAETLEKPHSSDDDEAQAAQPLPNIFCYRGKLQ